MEKRLEPEIMHPKKKLRFKRGLVLSCLLLVGVLSNLALPNSSLNDSTKGSSVSTKSVGLKERPSAIPNNGVVNPPLRSGPKCASRIIFLIDRSESVMNTVGGGVQNVNAIKYATNTIISQLGERAQSAGATSQVFINAFADTTVEQNAMFAAPSTNSDPVLAAEENFYRFLAIQSAANVADPFNRLVMINDVVGQSGVRDGIFFREDGNTNRFYLPPNPHPPGTPQYDSWNLNNFFKAFKGYPEGYTINSTNYESAFVKAFEQLRDYNNVFRFLSGGADPGPDEDFDLVVMITDGVPTSNNGPGGFSGQFSTPDDQDLLRAQSAINAIRVGGFTAFPPVPVIGIVAGQVASMSGVNSYMNQTFGAGNYVIQPDWNALQQTVSDQVSKYICTTTKNVTSGIVVSEAKAEPSPVREGDTGKIKIRITNSGNVRLTAVTATLEQIAPNGNYSTISGPNVIVPFGEPLMPGEWRDFDFGQIVRPSLGSASPFRFRITAGAIAAPFIGENVTNDRFPSTSTNVDVPLSRLPLPT